jgi:hypothetical protein
MMQTARQTGSKRLTRIIAGVAGVSFATAATAAGTGDDASAGVSAWWQSGATRGTGRAAERVNTRATAMTAPGGAEPEATGSATVKAKSKH